MSRRTDRGDSKPLADSRALVIERQRQAEARARAEALPHALTLADRRKLRKIADKPISHEAKIVEAFRAVGRLTATDMALDLMIGSPHPRIRALRCSGLSIEQVAWVRQPWGRGSARAVALYHLRAA